MHYHVTEYDGRGHGEGKAVCTIEAADAKAALMRCDGIDYAKEWPYSETEGSGMLACPDDPHRTVISDPMD